MLSFIAVACRTIRIDREGARVYVKSCESLSK